MLAVVLKFVDCVDLHTEAAMTSGQVGVGAPESRSRG